MTTGKAIGPRDAATQRWRCMVVVLISQQLQQQMGLGPDEVDDVWWKDFRTVFFRGHVMLEASTLGND